MSNIQAGLPVFLLVLGCSALAFAAGPEAIGTVKYVEGGAAIRQGGQSIDAAVGSPVHLNDNLATDAEGSIGITIKDGTLLSLGPDSEMEIDELVYDPARKNVGLNVNVAHGTFLYFSGRIAKVNPQAVTVKTPNAVIGIRGTRFLLNVAE